MRRTLVAAAVAAILAVPATAAADPGEDPEGEQVRAGGSAAAYAWGMADADLALIERQSALITVADRLRAEVEHSAGFTSLGFADATLVLRWQGTLPAKARAAVDRARAEAAISVLPARYSRTELRAASDRVKAEVLAGRGGSVHAIRIASDGSGLILAAGGSDAAARSALPAAVSSAAAGVDTSVTAEQSTRKYSRENDFAPWAGGAMIVNRQSGSAYYNEGCSSGFGVRSGGGFTYLLTASHCGTSADLFRDPTGESIGRVAARNHDKDIMLIRTSAVGEIYVGGPPGTAQAIKGVAGWSQPYHGQNICQSGAGSGNICGIRIEDVDDVACAEDPEGVSVGGTKIKCWTVLRARRLNGQLAGRPGDSGGPVYYPYGNRVMAVGTVTGGDGGAVLWFASFGGAYSAWGVSALTRSY